MLNEVTELLSHTSACVSDVSFKVTSLLYLLIPCVLQVFPSITLLVRTLERNGGTEEAGVVGFKADLLEAVLDRLGDFELERFYVISTFLDPKYVVFITLILTIIFTIMDALY